MDDDLIVPDTPEKLSFVNGLIARGQAVHVEKDQPLAAGVTHIIVGETENDHLPIVKRVRFSTF
jgi:hypothetical protein